MVRKSWVQSQVELYQRLYKWFLIPPCLTLGNISYISRVKWSNPGKGVAPSPTPQCSSYWKGNLLVALEYGRQLYLLTWYEYSKLYANKLLLLVNSPQSFVLGPAGSLLTLGQDSYTHTLGERLTCWQPHCTVFEISYNLDIFFS